jgi:outer membrane protein OmpA-like peptidoglycan-associated protein
MSRFGCALKGPMSESPPDRRPQDRKIADDASQMQLEALRRLIVGPTSQRLEDVARQVEDVDRHASAVSRVLPQAVLLSAERDNRLASVLEPTLENTLRASIQKDRRILVDALFPVMGPAIRKAIASTIQGLVQDFNQILEHSVSTRGLRWRLEAWRTGQPFGEVVLLHTLVYQVEQVFLIHRPSGLLVDHVVAKTAVSQNPDLVSGMLTAIKDFVQDSFGANQEDTLDTFQVGERKIWIEHGPYAILAVVIRGNPPADLHSMMRDALDEYHFKGASALADFQGDSTAFEAHRSILSGLLQARFKNRQAKPSYRVWIILALLVLIAGWAGFVKMAEGQRWRLFLGELRDQPGIVVTMTEKRNGQRHVYGLKDPYAPNPARIVTSAGIQPESVAFHWEAYHSGHIPFARRRIVSLFDPPPTIRTTFDQGRLAFVGSARHNWIEHARHLVHMLPWIIDYADGQVVDIDARLESPPGVILAMDGDTLRASGTAPHAWIAQAREISVTLPGIERFDDARLVDADVQAWETAAQAVEAAVFYFQAGGDTLVAEQSEAFQSFIAAVRQLATLSDVLDRTLHIDVIGYADQNGGQALNLTISRKRAQAIAGQMIAAGVDPRFISVRGAGYQPLGAVDVGQGLHLTDRRVVFEVSAADRQPGRATPIAPP